METPPPKIDPWEAREKERARYTRGSHRSRSRHRSDESSESDPLDVLLEDSLDVRQNYMAFGLLAAVVCQVLGQVASFSNNARTGWMVTGTLLLLVLLGTCRTFLDDMRLALRRGPNPIILALVVWTGISFFLAPYRPTALGEVLRVLAGVGAYFVAGYTLRSPRQTSLVVVGTLLLGIIISVSDLLRLGQHGPMTTSVDARNYSIIGTHGNVGSLLTLMVPAALAFAVNTRIEEKRRLAALAATLVLGGALLLSRTRSAWLGVFVALIVLTIFLLRGGKDEKKTSKPQSRRHGIIGLMESPVVMLVAGFIVFALVGGIAPLISHRAASVMQGSGNSTLLARVETWRGAVLMTLEKPLTGWGVGTFPVLQGQWTHAGDDTFSVTQYGANQKNMAHNYYVQWAADTGTVGLVLHVAVFAAFFFAVWPALKRIRNGFQLSLLAAAGATVAGALVDAIGSPAYHFSGVSTLLWVWLGLGIAALRAPNRREAVAFESVLGPTPWTVWTGAAACSAVAVLIIVGWGQTIRSQARTVPFGSLEVITNTIGPLKAGSSAQWRARFRDGAGKLQPTLPGTVWQIQMPPELIRTTDIERDPRFTNSQEADQVSASGGAKAVTVESSVRLFPRATAPQGTIAVHAFYRDRWGRLYSATALKDVVPR